MKLHHLFPAFFALPLAGCGFAGKTLGTVTGAATSLIGTVTAPLNGIVNAADGGSEKAWQEKADAQTRQKDTHDRRPVETKRAR